MTTYYYLGSRLLDTAPGKAGWNELDVEGTSIAHFCPKCGEIWGRTHVVGRDWMVRTEGCVKHGTWPRWGPGGSFILPWNHRAMQELPYGVLLYEFKLHYDWRVKNDAIQGP